MDNRAYARLLARFFHVHEGDVNEQKSAYIAPTAIVRFFLSLFFSRRLMLASLWQKMIISVGEG